MTKTEKACYLDDRNLGEEALAYLSLEAIPYNETFDLVCVIKVI